MFILHNACVNKTVVFDLLGDQGLCIQLRQYETEKPTKKPSFVLIVHVIHISVVLDCPDACIENPCTCDEVSNCQVCNEGSGCNQCENGYFKNMNNYQCTHCQDTFGDECMFCQDHNGCAQCIDGYSRVFDVLCGLYYCLPNGVSTPEVEDFSKALLIALENSGLDTEYYHSYVEYAALFGKLSEYPTDGSDNYAELQSRYSTFVETSVRIAQNNLLIEQMADEDQCFRKSLPAPLKH